MKLVIVESPTKAKTIEKYLGKDFRVLASGGHVCDLPEKSLGIDLDHNFQPEYVPVKEKRELIKRLKQAVKDSQEVYLATDPDREGEAISWHLSNVLDLAQDSNNRIEFNEISARAVGIALQNPRKINLNLVNAQQARRVLDRLVGYKISPILNKKIKQGLSAGRVQSAALKMIVDREREIRAFKPEEYWNIFAFLQKLGKVTAMKATLNDYNGKKIKVGNEEQANGIIAALKTASYFVDTVKRGVSRSKPGAPFTTSTLQQDGASRLSITAPEVMKIAQQLYEGIDLEGEGHTALVTYIRTDSVRVSPEAQAAAIDFIKKTYGSEYAPKKPNVYAAKGTNVQDAHEAIRPISLLRTPESLKGKLNRNQYRLYKLIYDRFLASQMAEAVYNTLNVHITAKADPDEYGFKISGKAVVFKGYTVAYENDKEEEEGSDKLPNLEEGEKLNLKEVKGEQKFTKAPPRYTDSTFIKAMEENGIGRPATYASVVSTLAKREYTAKDGKQLIPTQLGETVVEFMEKNFADIVDVKFTASMESDLDTVVNGTEWQKIISDFYPPFEKSLKHAYLGEKKVKLDEEVTDVICDKCGANMVVREGRYGKFLACPNFPKCKNIKNIVKPVAKCPSCGGDVVKKYTKNGKVFYGCTNFPECDFMSWELPAPIFCPDCRRTMRLIAKEGSTKYICTNKDCNKIIIPKENQ